TGPVLRRLDGDAEQGGRDRRDHGRERRCTRSGSGQRRLTRNAPPTSSTSTPPTMPSAIPTPSVPPRAGALATGFDPAPAPAPPASPGEAEGPGRAVAPAALFGGTSSPTGSTLPAALKPQSKSRAVSL